MSLAEDKFTKTELSSARPQLGILIDTRSLTVSITDDKRAKLIKLLSQFGPHRRAFHLKELAELTGVLNFLAYCSTWSTFCYVRIQEALVQSCVKLYTKFSKNPRYKHLFETSHGQTPPSFLEQIPFLLKEKATLIWRSKEKIALSHEARQQIKDITTILEQPTRYTWSRPIGSIIPRVCDWSQAGDASLTAGGGWCHHYQFWFHIEWPQHIRHETLMFKSPPTISINDLEFATAIIIIAASCQAWETDSMQGRRPQPKISHLIDNTAGQAWLTKPCTTSPHAKRLTSVLCSILLRYPSITIDPSYINTKDNTLADDISRLNSPPHYLTYSALVQKHPQVCSFRRFHPSPGLLSDIFCALQTPQQPAITRQRPLGHFAPGRGIGYPSASGTSSTTHT